MAQTCIENGGLLCALARPDALPDGAGSRARTQRPRAACPTPLRAASVPTPTLGCRERRLVVPQSPAGCARSTVLSCRTWISASRRWPSRTARLCPREPPSGDGRPGGQDFSALLPAGGGGRRGRRWRHALGRRVWASAEGRGTLDPGHAESESVRRLRALPAPPAVPAGARPAPGSPGSGRPRHGLPGCPRREPREGEPCAGPVTELASVLRTGPSPAHLREAGGWRGPAALVSGGPGGSAGGPSQRAAPSAQGLAVGWG